MAIETTPLTQFRPFQKEILGAPVALAESTGEVVVQQLVGNFPAGEYLIGISFVCEFTSANDQLAWRFAGDHTSGTFLQEAKDAAESIPFGYELPANHPGGALTSTLYASISGVGEATANIPFANIWVQRVA